MLNPALLAFHTRLDAAGVIAARHADHLCVRLDLLCSTRVRYDGQRLRCEGRVGPVSRALATVTTFAGAAGVVAGLAFRGAGGPILVIAGALGALAVGGMVLQYLLIEATITRVTLLWELERMGLAQMAVATGGVGTAPLDALPSPPLEVSPWPASVPTSVRQG